MKRKMMRLARAAYGGGLMVRGFADAPARETTQHLPSAHRQARTGMGIRVEHLHILMRSNSESSRVRLMVDIRAADFRQKFPRNKRR
jgi:hypothetical protein